MDIYLRRHESAHMTDDLVSVQTIDIPYAHFDNQPLNGRLYLPDQSIPKGFVVQIHGGGWCSGDRLQDAKFCEYLAKNDIAVFAIDFRMPPNFKYPIAVIDVELALTWFQANVHTWGGDKNNVGLVGMSSGGHLAGLAALRKECAYWIGCWPVLDPLARFKMALKNDRQDLIQNHNAFWADESEMWLGSAQGFLERRYFNFLPSALLIQGTQDENLEFAMIEKFVNTYKQLGGACKLMSFAGEPHAFIKRNPDSLNSWAALKDIVDFIKSR